MTNPRMIAVVGSHRTGTSCVAGMLHKLGVSVGKRLLPANAKNEAGYYEAVALRRFCNHSFKQTRPLKTHEECVAWLRTWADNRRETPVVGCKHPTLCCLLPEMLEVWPDLRVIATERPLEDIVASLKRANWWNNGRHPEKFIAKRDADLEALKIPTLRVNFADVVRDPASVVDAIIAFAGITPTASQRLAAINHMRPELRHVGATPTKTAETAAINVVPTDPIDVVYPLSKGTKWDDNELRYSLRSLDAYAGNLGQVFVVGHKPDWLTGVTHIPMEDANRRNKDANIINKVRAAIAAGASERFIFASDDQLLLTPTDLATLPATFGRHVKNGASKWWRRMQHTCKYLTSKGLPSVYYDTHLFQPHSAVEFERIVSEAPYNKGLGFCINTLVLNSYVGLVAKPSGEVRGRLMRGYDNPALKDETFKQALAKQFPTKSRYEL